MELLWNLVAGSQVHLVRCLTIEGGVRQVAVVLLDVKGHEFSDGGDGVERVQLEPLMFQYSPPGFDQRV